MTEVYFISVLRGTIEMIGEKARKELGKEPGKGRPWSQKVRRIIPPVSSVNHSTNTGQYYYYFKRRNKTDKKREIKETHNGRYAWREKG